MEDWRIIDLLMFEMEVEEVAEFTGRTEADVDILWSEYLDDPRKFDARINAEFPTTNLTKRERARLTLEKP